MKTSRDGLLSFAQPGRAGVLGWMLLLGASVWQWAGKVEAATIDLLDFLPYERLHSASLLSTTGSGFEFRFFSPTSDSGFDWDFRKGTAQRRQPFRRATLRKNATGLTIEVDTFYLPAPHVSNFDPNWVIAPRLVGEGEVVHSSAALADISGGSQWTGTVEGTVTVGTIEEHHTPVGKVDVLPLTIEYGWLETGPAGRGTGVVSQTWWLTRELGAYRTSFAYTETDTNGVMSAGGDEFHLATSTLLTSSPAVTFPDPNLEAAVRARVGKPTGDITARDLSLMLTLSAPGAGITNLTGLEYAYRLGALTLASNQVSDISVLAGLPRLVTLDLADNRVTDLEPLLNLTNLTRLTLTRNGITDIQPLRGLSRLTSLIADENLIADIGALRGLTNLQTAVLGANSITDVGPLAGLTGLILLEIEANRISDLTPLTTLTRLLVASVEENCLDVAPGADDRLVIDGWIARSTAVEEEWVIQYDCAAPVVTLALVLSGETPRLRWASEAGVSYRVESSTDLIAWSDAHPNPIPGNGEALEWLGEIDGAPQVFYRVRAE